MDLAWIWLENRDNKQDFSEICLFCSKIQVTVIDFYFAILGQLHFEKNLSQIIISSLDSQMFIISDQFDTQKSGYKLTT